MTALLNWRVWAVMGIAISLAASHWKVYKLGEHHVQADWDAQSLSVAKQSLRLSEEAARTTTNLEAEANRIKESKDVQIHRLNQSLSVALDGLRDRPGRTREGDMPTSTAAGANPGCTGAQLFRDDASLLVREADRADKLLANLAQCQAQYNAARKALNRE